MDADGYVSLTGRLKEIINRGGEKIAARGRRDPDGPPRRGAGGVLRHAAPQAGRGSRRRAVVLREGQPPPSANCRPSSPARGRLQGAAKVLFMDEIPKGATGKLQRIGLAAKLGLA
jgi:acyl-CoA synthetase (AMP-forming)/AMP-acid ligase II